MYDVGDIVPLGLSVTDADGHPANGGTVAVTVGQPDGTNATPTVTAGATGEYAADYTATQEGAHTVRWVVTGANATAYADVFNVRELGDQIVSLTEAKSQLNLTTNLHDDQLRMFIAASGRAIENHVGRVVVRRTFTEKHYGVCGSVILNRSPVVSVTSLATVDGATTWDVNDLDLDGDVGIIRTLTGAALRGNLRVVHVAGMRAIPANYLLAGRIITEHLWQTMRPFASASVPSVGALDDSLDARAGGLVGFAIPNRALELLGHPPPLVA